MTLAPALFDSARVNKPLLALKWLLLVLIATASVWAGYWVRVWQFNVTEPTHFISDVQRNWMWGAYTWGNIHDKGRSFFDTYDDLGIQNRDAHIFSDYAPLRMAVFTAWAASNEQSHPNRKFLFADPNHPGAAREFHAFYVDFNMAMEAIGAVGAFMLTRAVVRRSKFVDQAAEPWWTFTGCASGLAAALILWFNPAMWLSAHSWPGGDSWIIPPFLWTVFFAVRRQWFTAGVVLAIGALFKGQQFFVVIVLILWPLLQAKPVWSLRFVAGLLAMFGLATIGWTLTYVDALAVRHIDLPAVCYVISLAACAIALPLLRPVISRRFEDRRFAGPIITSVSIVICLLALAWPLLWVGRPLPRPAVAAIVEPGIQRWLVIGMLLITTLVIFFVPRRWIPASAAALAGCGALLCMPLFGTCFAWFDAGYLFGTNHWTAMVTGLTSNLPGLLKIRYGWEAQDVLSPSWATLNIGHTSIDLPMRTLLAALFAVLLLISAIGISMQDRRHSTRLLVAICTPWLLFFCIPAQIHERYLLFGGAIAAVCVGESIGMALLGIFLSAVTWIMTMHVLNNDGWRQAIWNRHLTKMYPNLFPPGHDFAQTLQRFLDGTHPDIGWAVLLATAIFFYVGMTPLWRCRRVKAVVVQPLNDQLPIVATAPITAAPIVALPDRPLPSTEPIPLD